MLSSIPRGLERPQGHHFLRACCCTGTGMPAWVQLGLRWTQKGLHWLKCGNRVCFSKICDWQCQTCAMTSWSDQSKCSRKDKFLECIEFFIKYYVRNVNYTKTVSAPWCCVICALCSLQCFWIVSCCVIPVDIARGQYSLLLVCLV